jgi:hypothetical protein
VSEVARPSESDTYPTPPHGWTCFHCGETFLPTLEGQIMAKRHFGFDVNATPGCIEKLTAPERSLLLRIRASQAENDRLRAEAEDEFGERYYARLASDIRSTAGVFRDCRTLRDLFNLYDSMEGRALAAEEQLAAFPELPDGGTSDV